MGKTAKIFSDRTVDLCCRSGWYGSSSSSCSSSFPASAAPLIAPLTARIAERDPVDVRLAGRRLGADGDRLVRHGPVHRGDRRPLARRRGRPENCFPGSSPASPRIPLAKTIYGQRATTARSVADQAGWHPARSLLLDFPSPGTKSVGFVTRLMLDEATGRETGRGVRADHAESDLRLPGNRAGRKT